VFCFRFRFLGSHLIVKVPQPGDSEGQCSHYDFGVSACAQKISGFGMGKVKNELACAQQKC